MPNIVALIPARSGSVRIKDKNVRPLNGIPLLAYTIVAAWESGIFLDVVVSTDSDEYAEIAIHYGGGAIRRPAEYATDDSPDFAWVNHAVGAGLCDAFAILRPTSPFRSADTIRCAWEAFQAKPYFDSLRAVNDKPLQHPHKMWVPAGDDEMVPLISARMYGQPTHSLPTQLLPTVYPQNASLEIAWTKTLRQGNISGNRVMKFITPENESLDLNTEDDWERAESLVATGRAILPTIDGVRNGVLGDNKSGVETQTQVPRGNSEVGSNPTTPRWRKVTTRRK